MIKKDKNFRVKVLTEEAVRAMKEDLGSSILYVDVSLRGGYPCEGIIDPTAAAKVAYVSVGSVEHFLNYFKPEEK